MNWHGDHPQRIAFTQQPMAVPLHWQAPQGVTSNSLVSDTLRGQGSVQVNHQSPPPHPHGGQYVPRMGDNAQVTATYTTTFEQANRGSYGPEPVQTMGVWGLPKEYSFGDIPVDNQSVDHLDIDLIRSLVRSSGTKNHRTPGSAPTVQGPIHGPPFYGPYRT